MKFYTNIDIAGAKLTEDGFPSIPDQTGQAGKGLQSTGVQTVWSVKVSSVNGYSGTVVLLTSDLSDFSTAVDARITLQKAQPLGLASLDGSGKVPSVQLPTTVFPVTTVFSRTGAITAQSGDYTTTLVTEGTNLYFTTARASAAAPVQSVAGKTGDVIVTQNDVGLGNVNNTSDVNKPVSTAQGLADTAVQNYSIQRANHTGTQSASTITGLATVATSGLKADVGLGNVPNVDATQPANINQNSAYRFVSDTEKTTWNAKQDASAKGQANGYASLDSNGFIPVAQIPAIAETPYNATRIQNGSLSVTIPQFAPVCIDTNGNGILVDVSNESNALSIIGIALTAMAPSAAGAILTDGTIMAVTGSFNYGDHLYVSTTGTLTSALPTAGSNGFTAGDWVIKMGIIVRDPDTVGQKNLILNVELIGQL